MGADMEYQDQESAADQPLLGRRRVWPSSPASLLFTAIPRSLWNRVWSLDLDETSARIAAGTVRRTIEGT